jgi:membrane protein
MLVVNLIVSIAILAVLFSAMFKFLPDAHIAWRSVWVGGLVTAVLFEIGKFVIGLYLGHSNPGSAFGAASAFAVILVWIYYAGVLVLFGAEFTEHYARTHGDSLRPKQGAVRIKREEQILRDGAEESNAGDNGGRSKPVVARAGQLEQERDR